MLLFLELYRLEMGVEIGKDKLEKLAMLKDLEEAGHALERKAVVLEAVSEVDEKI
jgi:hypothetical protein